MRVFGSGAARTDHYSNYIRQQNNPTCPDIVQGNAIRPGARFQTRSGGTWYSGVTECLRLPATPLIVLLENSLNL